MLPTPSLSMRFLWFFSLTVLHFFVSESLLAQRTQSVAHAWKRVYYGQIDGAERLLFGGRMDRVKPALGDLDGDGDADMLLGGAGGEIMFYENHPKGKKPRWRLANASLLAVMAPASVSRELPMQPVDVGENAAPALVDIDGDDDLDLFVGGADGRISFFRNEGNRYLAVFHRESNDYLGHNLGLNPVIRFADVNGDGLEDLTLGNEEGVFMALPNQGSRFAPLFCPLKRLVRTRAPQCVTPPLILGKLNPEDNAVPNWVDWDSDGDLDLMVGKSDGRISFYLNIGSRREGIWELKQTRFMLLDAGGYSAPISYDLNGDKKQDLLLGSSSDRLFLYTRLSGPAEFPLRLEGKNMLAVHRLSRFQSRLHIASGDLDNDGDKDLIIGTAGGKLIPYENLGRNGNVGFRSMGEPLLPTPQRALAAPALADVDGDGDLDLVVGGRSGRLELIRNTGSKSKPRWKVTNLFFGGVDAGALSVPLLRDLDADGDLDLLVGNSLGQILFYRNRGDAKQALFRLLNLKFSGIDVAFAASPAFFSYRKKAPPDLVVGSRSGVLISAVRNPRVPVVRKTAYRVQKGSWGSLRVEKYSAPHFVDLTGDGRADLLMGDADGNLALWEYRGTRKTLAATRSARRPMKNNRTKKPESISSLFSSETVTGVLPPRGKTQTPPARAKGARVMEPVFVAEKSPLRHMQLGRGTRPVLVDLTGDGKPELVVGNNLGKLFLLRNEGNSTRPQWKIRTGALDAYEIGRNAAPAFYDMDGDGDRDLVVGTETGRVHYLENTGTHLRPLFVLRKKIFSSLSPGKNAVPTFADLDGDRIPELVVGNLQGWLYLFSRVPGGGMDFKPVRRRFIGLDVGLNASPLFGFLKGSQHPPLLLVGSDSGNLAVMTPTGTSLKQTSGWRTNRVLMANQKLPPGSHPALGDLDGDGDLDLLVGSDKGPILFFRNHAIFPQPR